MRTLFLQQNKGQILIEVMVALAMVVIGMLGLLSLLSNSIGTSKVVSDQYVGSYLAAEGIEIVKHMLDSNAASINRSFTDGISQFGVAYEVDYSSSQLIPSTNRFLRFGSPVASQSRYNYSTGAQTPFRRTVVLEAVGGSLDEIKVTSTVTWTSRGGAVYSIVLEDYFFNWRSS